MNPHKRVPNNSVEIHAVGTDQIGILAKLTAFLAEQNINILDTSQTIMQDFFTIHMAVDLKKSSLTTEQLQKGLLVLAEKMSIEIHVQSAEEE